MTATDAVTGERRAIERHNVCAGLLLLARQRVLSHGLATLKELRRDYSGADFCLLSDIADDQEHDKNVTAWMEARKLHSTLAVMAAGTRGLTLGGDLTEEPQRWYVVDEIGRALLL